LRSRNKFWLVGIRQWHPAGSRTKRPGWPCDPSDPVSDSLSNPEGFGEHVCSAMGVQFCDQAGRVNGILNLPPNKRAANLCFGGEKMDTLYVCAGDKVYRRRR
jgi:gluconolactonase